MSIIDQILVDEQPVNKAVLRRYLAAREFLNLRDFGAAGDGIADDSAAIQAAVTAAKGQPLWVPPGDYLLGKPLVFAAPTKTHAPAPRLYGAGPAASRFLYRGREAALLVTQEAGYRFLKNGVLSGLAFVGNGGGADQHGLSFSGAWQWLLEDIEISAFGGDAIHSPRQTKLGVTLSQVERAPGSVLLQRRAGGFLAYLRPGDAISGDGIAAGAVIAEVIGDASLRMSHPAESGGAGDVTFSGNSDAFQSLITLNRVRMMRCGGWGIAGQSGLGLIIDWRDCTIQECGGGGALLGATARIVGGVIAANGAKASAQTTAGLRLIRAPAIPQLLSVERIEFDSNNGAQIRLEWVSNARIFQCRFISHLQSASQIMAPPVGVTIGASESGNGSARQVRLDQCAFRADAQGKAAYAGVELGAAGTYADIEILQPLWITLTAPEQVKIKGTPHPGSAVRMIESGQTTLGKPSVAMFAIARLAADTLLPPGQETEANITQLIGGGSEIIAEGLSMTGVWRIEAHVTLAGLDAQEKGVVTVRIGPSLQREQRFFQTGSEPAIVSGSWTVLATRGWRIAATVKRMAGSSVARILGGDQRTTLFISQVG